MPVEKKEIEIEVIVTNVRSRGESVILDLRFAKPRFEEPTERRLEDVIEPLPKSPMEKAGRDVAKGYAHVIQRQMQKQMQSIPQFLRPTPPPDTICVTLSKEEYLKLGRPTVEDKITLVLSAKNT